MSVRAIKTGPGNTSTPTSVDSKPCAFQSMGDLPTRSKDFLSTSFAARIQMLSEHFGGATEIGRRCGFSEGVVRSWRDGKSDPSRVRCVTLARTLGVSLVWLMTGEGAIWAGDTIGAADDVASSDAGAQALIPSDGDSGVSLPNGAQRTSIALRILCGAIELSSVGCLPSELVEMTERVYDMLGPSGQVIDALAMADFLHYLVSRRRSG